MTFSDSCWFVSKDTRRDGGADSADDPASQNSEHSGVRYLSMTGASAAQIRQGVSALNGGVPLGLDSDDSESNGVSRQVRESDHRTSSEMIADLMDSEERIR